MKKVLIAACLLVSSNAIFAQINKGQWLVGGNVGFDSRKQGDTKVTSFNISPNAGYFFKDNFAGGLRLNYSSSKVKSESDAYSMYSVAPFLRYYFLPTAQKVNVFADGSYEFGSAGYDDKTSYNAFQIMAGPAVFLSPNTALEFALYYRSAGGDAYKVGPDDDRDNHFGISIGFQVHLGSDGKK